MRTARQPGRDFSNKSWAVWWFRMEKARS